MTQTGQNLSSLTSLQSRHAGYTVGIATRTTSALSATQKKEMAAGVVVHAYSPRTGKV